MKLLGVSSPKSSAVSLDLLNLYVVNQISTKKETSQIIRKPVHIDITEDGKIPVRRHNIELPISPPRAQHVSSLDDIQNRLEKQVLDSRRQHTTEKAKYQYSSGSSSEQDSWITKPPSQWISRRCDPVPQEVFKPLHRLDCMHSARKNPVIMTSNESEKSGGIKEPLFDVVKETAELKGPRDGSDSSFLALFEDESQPIHNYPSTKHFSHFGGESRTGIFFIDPDARNQMNNRNYLYDTREAYPAINTRKCSVDRHLEGIFTAPEQVLLKSNNVLCANYRKNSELPKTYLQGCHEGQHYFIPSEKKEKPANLEEIETFAYHHDEWMNAEENEQNCSRRKRIRDDLSSGKHVMVTEEKKNSPVMTLNSERKEKYRKGNHLAENSMFAPFSEDKSVTESAWRQNRLFGFEEKLTTAQEKESKFGMSSDLQEMETDMESSLSSQSHNYSPRQTESCFSSSPDRSEQEDLARKEEYLNEHSLKIDDVNLILPSASTEFPKTSHTRTVPLQLSSILAREAAKHLQEEVPVLHPPEEDNNNHTTPSEGSSLPQALQREHATRSTRRDVCSQTESPVAEVRKVDVGSQCGSMKVCSCGGSLPAARSPGRLAAASSTGTAGGHTPAAPEALQPAGSAAARAALASEAEYLSLAGRRTLEVLNYIDIMKEREKQ